MVKIDFKERIKELKESGFTTEQVIALSKYIGSSIYLSFEEKNQKETINDRQ